MCRFVRNHAVRAGKYASLGALLLTFAAPRPANAVLQLSFTATDTTTLATNSQTFVDGGFGDASTPGGNTTQDGILTLANGRVILPGVTVNGSTSEALGTPPLASAITVLSSGSSSITNNTADTVHIVVAVSATDFTAGRVSDSVTGSGTFQLSNGSSISLGWYDDPTNTQGADNSTDHPGNLIDSFNFVSTSTLDSFAVNDGPFTVSDPNPFSMTLTFDFTLLPGGSLISRGQSEIKEVPEPFSLAIMGSGLIALSSLRAFRRRRNACSSPFEDG
jgi:hypothetical protein